MVGGGEAAGCASGHSPDGHEPGDPSACPRPPRCWYREATAQATPQATPQAELPPGEGRWKCRPAAPTGREGVREGGGQTEPDAGSGRGPRWREEQLFNKL